MTESQSQALTRLLDLRDNISHNLIEIQDILHTNFTKEYEQAYQHWIPQVITALYNDTRWLPRGLLTCQDTIDHIKDNGTVGTGVSKFIK